MKSESPEPSTIGSPATVNVTMPSSEKTVSSKASWLCGGGANPPAGTVISNIVKAAAVSVSSKRKRTRMSRSQMGS
jgi:hypothetical protein